MAFSPKQTRQLRARLKPGAVREREVEGKTLHYIEGWHALTEANRIFGFDGWDRETLSSQCVWQKALEGRYAVAYLTRVRITVRAGDRVVLREGLGSGEALSPSLGQAHERAAKAAETDATKRALSTFGNSFGLSLYAGKFEPVQEAPRRQGAALSRPKGGTGGSGRRQTANDNQAPVLHSGGQDPATRPRVREQTEIPTTNEAPAPSVTAYRVSAPLTPSGLGRVLETVRPPASQQAQNENRSANDTGQRLMLPVTAHILPTTRIPVDKSALPLSEPKRLRSIDHLRFVAKQPCLVCGRHPAQAHHLRYAQPRALARKVSDEFTVPLCNFHHDEVHRTGNEFQWWRARGLDPLEAAKIYWSETRDLPGGTASLVDGPTAADDGPALESPRSDKPAAPP